MMTVIKNYDNHFEGKKLSGIDSYFYVNHSSYDLSSEFVDRVVEAIDKSPRVIGNIFNSPVFGYIPPDKLAGGSKALFCILNDDPIGAYNSTLFANNCLPFLFELSHSHDFILVVRHTFNIENCRDCTLSAKGENGEEINTPEDLVMYMVNPRLFNRS